ncbi:hypothetical protein H8A95_08895 [Bradyrhizobium sp. Pear76]|nr:hypothetical protein [Bradyrhizobium oropedii]
MHLTPTSSSSLNQVERFFALLTDKKIRRGIYRSIAALRVDITSFIERHNADPKPFQWSKSADDILASIERFCRYDAPAENDVMLRTSGSDTSAKPSRHVQSAKHRHWVKPNEDQRVLGRI